MTAMESNRGLQGDMIAPIPGYGGTQSVETGAPMLHSTTAVMTGTRANAVPVLVPRRAWVVDQIPIGGAPHRPLFTPNGQSGLVINQHLDELEILDPVKV
jgi:hypothetical protein